MMLARLALAAALLLPSAFAAASDHLDSPKAIADPRVDIGDIYAWTSADGRRLNLVMTIVGHALDRNAEYAFHIDSGPRYPDTTARTDIVCRFPSKTQADCLIGRDETIQGDALSHLPPDRFAAYVAEEGLWPAAAARGRDVFERYRRVAKALIQAGAPGEGSQDLATKRLGLPLEIVLAQPPSDGDTLAAQVIFQGRPLARALVKLTDLDHDAQPVAAQVTDDAGKVHLRRPPPGQWLLNVVWTTPLDGDAGIDFDTIFSSLSFGIAP